MNVICCKDWYIGTEKMMEKEDVIVYRSLCKVAVTVFFFVLFFVCVINTGQCVGFHMLLNNYCFIDSWMCIYQ